MVGDIVALAALVNLQHLHLSWCKSMIGKFRETSSSLTLRCCVVGDMAALASLINLQHLHLSGCSLGGMIRDTCSIVRCCVVGDITALASLINLQHLHLSGSDMTTGKL